jgi:hypothetical protein
MSLPEDYFGLPLLRFQAPGQPDTRRAALRVVRLAPLRTLCRLGASSQLQGEHS